MKGLHHVVAVMHTIFSSAMPCTLSFSQRFRADAAADMLGLFPALLLLAANKPYLPGNRHASQDAAFCLRMTTIAVMLSQPTPRAALGSAARHSSSSAHAASVGLTLACSF